MGSLHILKCNTEDRLCVCVLIIYNVSTPIIIIIIHFLFSCLQSGRAAGKPSDATGPSSSTVVTQTLEQVFKRQAAYAPTSKNAQDLTAALSYYIAKDMMPFQIVERPGFLRLMKVAVPHYKVPSPTLFYKTEIPNLYNQVKADVGKSLAQGTWFAATTDLWTSESRGWSTLHELHYPLPHPRLATGIKLPGNTVLPRRSLSSQHQRVF